MINIRKISLNSQQIYMFVGLIPFLIYSFYHISVGIVHIGIVSLIDFTAIATMLRLNLQGKSKRWHNYFLFLMLSTSVLYICYFIGMRGIVFIFPVVIGMFFNFSLIIALYLATGFTILALTFSLHTLEVKSVLRAAIPVVITVVLSFMYALRIEQHKQALVKEAEQDFLTGIYNRRSFMRWLADKMEQDNSVISVFFIDIDNFKRINDNYGHGVGDLLLIEVSKRLASALSHKEVIEKKLESKAARIAGDEFCVAIEGMDYQAQAFGEYLLSEINKPIFIDELTIVVQASIGVATKQAEGLDDPDTLMNHADFAMFEAKKKGKNQVGYFSHEVAEQLKSKNDLLMSVEKAVANKNFSLQFMPIFDKQAKIIVGAETIITATDTVLSKVSRRQYIKLAEEYGLIEKLDYFVIQQSFNYLHSVLPLIGNNEFKLAINISSLELKNPCFVEDVKAMVIAADISPHRIAFELTETSLVGDNEESIVILQELKDFGFQFSLDDFGTGFTAFSQMQHYPVDTLKVDKSFISALKNESDQKAPMAEVILSLAKFHQLKVIADGVTNKSQLLYLQSLNCDFYQGSFLSNVLTAAELERDLLDQFNEINLFD